MQYTLIPSKRIYYLCYPVYCVTLDSINIVSLCYNERLYFFKPLDPAVGRVEITRRVTLPAWGVQVMGKLGKGK